MRRTQVIRFRLKRRVYETAIVCYSLVMVFYGFCLALSQVAKGGASR